MEPLLRSRSSPTSPSPGDKGGSSPPNEVDPQSDEVTPPQPSAPPMTSMDQISGYANIGFETEGLPPNIPPPLPAQSLDSHTQGDATPPNLPSLNEDEARQALLEMASSRCCYGKAAARELIFTNITCSNAFHYQLETFTEARKTVWEYEPYNGQAVDGPANGPAPAPWDILAQPGQMFHNHEKCYEVPHTGSVKSCHNCSGSGYNQCWQCLGTTTMRCHTCDGTGQRLAHHHHHDHHHHHHHQHHHHHHHHHHHVTCYTCGGSGRRMCGTCQGRGRVPCEVCLSRGQLKCYIKLTVSWKTHRAEEVVERTPLPDELIKTAEGMLMCQDQQFRVLPINNFPDPAINTASTALVQSHFTAFPSERIVMQRHWVRVVPVAEAGCSWNSKSFTFYVYGRDQQVYAPDYPQRYCWGCAIL